MFYVIVTSDNDFFTFSVSVMELNGTLWNFTFGGKVSELY